LFAAPTQAHSPFDPRIRVEVDGLSPASPDVRVVASFDVGGLPPRMTARNDGTAVLEIPAAGGEPLFRIGPDGSFGNVRSPSYRSAVDPFRVLGAPATKSGPGPDWRKLSADPIWRWYEDRANLHGRVPAAIAATAGPVDVARWHIPAKLGGKAISIAGRIVWKAPKGQIRARVLPPRWAPKGVEVTALQGPLPGLQVRNSTPVVFEILGRDNAPFARIGASGVDVNTQSVTWADSKGIPEPAGAGPRWRHETDLPVLIWVESRAAYGRSDPPEEVERGKKEQVLLRWEVPASLGGKHVVIQGETYWRPLGVATKRSGAPYVTIVALVILAAGAGYFVRRRAGRAAVDG
jgi:hypothetical protein